MIEPEGGKTFPTKKCNLGIDEAGRGPVLGHMVYACWYWPGEYEIKDKKKVNSYVDSKKTTEAERERIMSKIENARLAGELNYKYVPLDPKDLSNDQLGNVRNLNKISHDTAIALIQATLDEGTQLSNVYVDTVGPPDKYKHKLDSYFAGKGITFWVESKADDNYRSVSAASIVAKFYRDSLLKEWKFMEASFNSDEHRIFGWGYPGDPVTKKWLTRHMDPVFGFPTIVRFSWSTWERMINDSPMGPENTKVSWYFPWNQKYETATASYKNSSSELKKVTGLAKEIGLEPF